MSHLNGGGRTERKEKTYAALERSAVDVVAIELANGHGGVLVGVHLDKGKATVGLETGLGNVTEVLEQRHKV